jgi:hypothetical protein
MTEKEALRGLLGTLSIYGNRKYCTFTEARSSPDPDPNSSSYSFKAVLRIRNGFQRSREQTQRGSMRIQILVAFTSQRVELYKKNILYVGYRSSNTPTVVLFERPAPQV